MDVGSVVLVGVVGVVVATMEVLPVPPDPVRSCPGRSSSKSADHHPHHQVSSDTSTLEHINTSTPAYVCIFYMWPRQQEDSTRCVHT